ncbi:MAG: four-carbon acid sugar kinase family protein [Bryobacterales bacterium]
MSRHPVTPMDEADLRLHLGRQTAKGIASFDILCCKPSTSTPATPPARHQPGVVLFDVLDEASLAQVGGLLWQEATGRQTFVAGSSGVEYALVAHWREAGLLLRPRRSPPPKSTASSCLGQLLSCHRRARSAWLSATATPACAWTSQPRREP